MVEAIVLMNGRRGQRGDEIGQTTRTMVLPWFYDGADEKGRHRRTAFWRRDAPGLAFPGIKSAGGNVKGLQTVPGSHLTPSGGTEDGLGGRRTVPTASGARRASSRGGKGVKRNVVSQVKLGRLQMSSAF